MQVVAACVTLVRVTCLEGVPGKGDVGEGDDLAVALSNLKVLEQYHCWRWLKCLALKFSPHDYLP